MILNDKIISEYSKLTSVRLTTSVPTQFKPVILSDEYSRGYFNRCCIIKRNDTTDGYEIDPSLSGSADRGLYYVITFPWRVSGKKNRTVVNGIIEDFGVLEMNTNTLRNQVVSLTRFFPNPLEFWRGK
jgi:hypothetical protein